MSEGEADLPFSSSTARWFREQVGQATPVQAQGWPIIAKGEHALLLAPTGSGKTLAAFLYAIDRCVRAPSDLRGNKVIYVSPLKALVYDVERNLKAPLAGVFQAAQQAQGDPLRCPSVAVRTGDTSPKERERQRKHPADIVVTTPESLFLMLGSRHRENFGPLHTVIIDEIHAIAGSKRGAHLALSLERLSELAEQEPQRIGLSATVRPKEVIARYLGGTRPVAVIDTLQAPNIEVEVWVPDPDKAINEASTTSRSEPSAGRSLIAQIEGPREELGKDRSATLPDSPSAWHSIYPELVDRIEAHRSVIIFVNSRALAERLTKKINEIAWEREQTRLAAARTSSEEASADKESEAGETPEPNPVPELEPESTEIPSLALAHHGSVSHQKRREIEEQLKSGQLRAIVATSSLELGIDMGAVDLVIMVQSPPSVASALQRIGRAGHQVGARSCGKIIPKFRGDILEATAIAEGMQKGAIEAVRPPQNPLDVLAQQIAAIVGTQTIKRNALHQLLQKSDPFRELSSELLDAVLDMLSGNFPSTDFSELRGCITWDRHRDELQARPGTAMLTMLNAGTIPNRGLYTVYSTEGGRLGELDEEMVHELRTGQNFLLGTSTWRVTQITRDRVLVRPAPGEPGQLPFWRGEGPGRPLELGRAMGHLIRKLDGQPKKSMEAFLEANYPLNLHARQQLADYLSEQREHNAVLPHDKRLVVERFRDELGDWRICILSPFGARIHAPWSIAIEARLRAELDQEIQCVYTDDGIVVRVADQEGLPGLADLIPASETIEEQLLQDLSQSAVFASHFRENAARALLLPRRRPNKRTPLWAQRLRSQNLLQVALRFPNFPIVLESYRSCLRDHFDLPGLQSILRDIESGAIQVHEVHNQSPSPFARSLAFAYVAQYLYEGDAPLAERKAHALSLDRSLLRELLGQEQLRELLDPEIIAQVQAELQRQAPKRRAQNPEQLVDLLQRTGDLSPQELEERSEAAARAGLAELEATFRVVKIRLAGEMRYVAAPDVALYRDAFGVLPPTAMPQSLLTTTQDSLLQILSRYSRVRGPFGPQEPKERYGLSQHAVERELERIVAQKRLLQGEFLPGGEGMEYCAPEVLQRIRRETLAKLQRQVAPVDGRAYTRFLFDLHEIGRTRDLDDALDQLQGCPLPFSALESSVLPSRLPRYRPEDLDQLCQSGSWVWVGTQAMGPRDGKVAFYRREEIGGMYALPPLPEEATQVHRELLDALKTQGACFFFDLVKALSHLRQSEILEALWELVWWGQVSNDGVQALRHYLKKAPSPPRKGAGYLRQSPSRRRRALPQHGAGRWVLLAPMLEDPPQDTERCLSWTQQLLLRYGVLSAASVQAESLRGGFSPFYLCAKALEEQGQVRRGYFVEEFQGAQFAFAGTIDRLRAHLPEDPEASSYALHSCDPANPFGTLLPWPPHERTPRRQSQSWVILNDGALVLYLRSLGKHWQIFQNKDTPPNVEALVTALRGIAAKQPQQSLEVLTIDDNPAHLHSWAKHLRQAGFVNSPRGLVLRAPSRHSQS